MEAFHIRLPEDLPSQTTTLNFDEDHDEYEIVCLDVEINDGNKYQDMKDVLQSIRCHIHSFTDTDCCLEYLMTHWFCRIFLVVSDRLIASKLSQVEKLDHVVSVFIFCDNTLLNNPKVIFPEKYRGAFQDKNRLLSTLQEHIFLKTSVFSTMNFSRKTYKKQQSILDSSDMRTFSVLSDMNHMAQSPLEDTSISFDKQQMLRECRLYYKDNKSKLKEINEFSQTYNPSEAIKWYSKDSFLYRLVNTAIRTQSSEIIGKFRFFIKDLEESLDLLFAKQIFDQWSSSHLQNDQLLCVYRGQTLSHDDMIKLQSLSGKHITISQYISTTKDISVAEIFAGVGTISPDFESVVYAIDMSVIYKEYNDKPDPSIYYCNISHISNFSNEEEILFRPGTIFKLMSIEKSSDGSWRVVLRLEKFNDYRCKNTIDRTPTEVVHSFFHKASQRENVNLEDLINKRLSSDAIVRMSVLIRLGNLVKHHPREQLQYYQSALSIIPSSESVLLKVGYWAIRIRCFSNVNDWTAVPVNIYRQTVFHVHEYLKNQLHRELAWIDEARGDFQSSIIHCSKILKHTNDSSEKQLISKDIERLNGKINDIKPILPSDQVAYWYLYITVLTSEERSLIDHQCKMFHQSIEKRYLSKYFSFTDILPDSDDDEYDQLIHDYTEYINMDDTELPIVKVFVKTLTDRPLELTLEKDMTLYQFKQTIRRSFDIPYPSEYDFRLIYLGESLIDDHKSLNDYQIYDQSIIYLVHGPRIQEQPMNRLARELYENTGLTASNITRTLTAETIRVEKEIDKLQKYHDAFANLRKNRCANGTVTSESLNSAYEKFFQDTLSLNQHDEDEDADPNHLLDMSHSTADEYIQNSGPHTSVFQLFDLFGGFSHRSKTEWSNNDQNTLNNDPQQYQQTNDDNDDYANQLRQKFEVFMTTGEYPSPPDCTSS